MTKHELMKNYTMEQLADMVIKYQNASEVKNDEIQKLKWTISNLEESNGRLQTKVNTYVNYILPRTTKEAKELLGNHHYVGVKIVTIREDKKKCDCGKEDEINCLKDQLQRKEIIINQIDDILNELFGVTHDVVNKPDEFKKILEEKIKNSKDISDFLPTEPIKVADIIINYQRKPNKTESLRLAFANREITEETKVNQFNILQLREIAEYLLVYCNVNKIEE